MEHKKSGHFAMPAFFMRKILLVVEHSKEGS